MLKVGSVRGGRGLIRTCRSTEAGEVCSQGLFRGEGDRVWTISERSETVAKPGIQDRSEARK